MSNPSGCNSPTNQNRSVQAEDYQLRTLQVVDLASQLATEAFEHRYLDEPLNSFVDALLEQPLQHLSLEPLSAALSVPGWKIDEWENQRDHEHEVLLANSYEAQRMGFHGIGVQFGTPVRTYFSPTSFQSSWGYMGTVWIYSSSMEDAWQQGLLWATEIHNKALIKAGFSAEAKAHE